MPNSFTKPVSANDILSALGGIAVDLGTSSGSANALAGASTVDTGTTFTSGRLYRIRANAANTGAATCSINGGTGVAMRKSPSSAPLASGDIANGTELLLFFDGTYLQVLAGLTVSAVQSATDGAAGLYGADGASVRASGPTSAYWPSSVTLKSPGKAFTNNGTWTNFYSLAEGTHNGSFYVYCSGSKSYFQFSITGTTLAVEYTGWGPVCDASGSPTPTQVGFRVSGGWVQINVGTGLASNLYFHAEYHGNVR